MNPTVKNIVAVLAGAIVGSIVNGLLITVSGSIIPPPNGADVTTIEGLKEAMHLFEPKHFLFPFLAHALGTLVGAFLAVKIAASHKLQLALVVGGLFLIGGTINVVMLPAPMWFNILDLAGAYIPMAYLGWKLGEKKQ